MMQKHVLRRLYSTGEVKPLEILASITKLNEQIKHKNKEKREEKTYIAKMGQNRLDKIGGQTLLDKQWAD